MKDEDDFIVGGILEMLYIEKYFVAHFQRHVDIWTEVWCNITLYRTICFSENHRKPFKNEPPRSTMNVGLVESIPNNILLRISHKVLSNYTHGKCLLTSYVNVYF